MTYDESKVKKIIRERLWKEILNSSGVKEFQNPHAVSELLEQNQELLNARTKEVYEGLLKLMGVKEL